VNIPKIQRGMTFYPGRVTREGDSIIFPFSSSTSNEKERYAVEEDGIYEAKPIDEDYDLWLWIIARSQTDPNLSSFNEARLEELREEFRALQVEQGVHFLDRRKTLIRISLQSHQSRTRR